MEDFHPYNIFKKSYGGVWQFIGSEYAIVSGIITAISTSFWLPDAEKPFLWVGYVFSILPSLLSFSIGGFTVFLSFSHPRVLKLAKEDANDDSLFMQICSAFYTFIILQVSSIFFAILMLPISNFNFSFLTVTWSFLGFFLFCYAVLSVVSVATTLLQMGLLINRDL